MRCALVLSLLIACGSSKPVASRGSEADKLWALAPTGAVGGIVITPHGVGELVKAVARVQKEIAAYPELAIAKPLLANLTRFGLDRALGDIGIAGDRGLAMFGTVDDALVILPVGDRQKFVAAMKGTSAGDLDSVFGVSCKVLPQGYACAKNPALFDLLGKGSLVGKPVVDGRGDAELWFGPEVFSGKGDIAGLSASILLDDGVLDASAFLQTKLFDQFVTGESFPPDPKGGDFLVANLGAMRAGLPPGVAKALKGPVSSTMSTSARTFFVRIPLTDPAQAQQLLEHCDLFQLGIKLTPADGVCRFELPSILPIAVEAWIEGGELRLAPKKGAFDPGTGPERTSVGKDLATYPFALWGRGSLFALHLAQQLASAQLPELPAFLRVFAQLSEFGAAAKVDAAGVHARFYVRTIWTDALAEQIAAIPVLTGDDQAAALAAAHPDSAFARDLAAGPGGLLMPTSVIGGLAATAVPAFLDYQRKAKGNEAQRRLTVLAKNAKAFYAANTQYPMGKAALTPSAPCCGQPDNRCAPADWSAPVWKALDFETAGPTQFQYSYTSDGDTFTAIAVGDLDCDGVAITYTLSGTADHGNPVTTLTEPPPNSD